MKVKSKEIAMMLGVSEATVSLALNGKPGVSERTRRRVLKCLDNIRQSESMGKQETGYTARGSIKVFMYISGIAYYDDITNNLFSTSYLTMFQMASEKGMDLKLLYVTDDDDADKLLWESERDGTLGIFFSTTAMDKSELERYRNCRIPIVVDDIDVGDLSFDNVMIDNRMAVRQCMRHLQEMGHTDILLFENSTQMYNFASRRSAFLEYAAQNGLPLGEESCVKMGTTIEEVYEHVLSYMKKGGRLPTAILAESYAVSVGTIQALEDCGYRIPEDVSIVGIDDLPGTLILDFAFTHVSINHREKIRRGMNCLFDQMEGRSGGTAKLYVGTELVAGDSVKNLKA